MTGEKLNEKEIFNVAREIDSPEARVEYLRRACGGDAHWIERVQTLLRGYEEHASFLESPPVAVDARRVATAEEPIAEQLGTVIGPYKLGDSGFSVGRGENAGKNGPPLRLSKRGVAPFTSPSHRPQLG